MNIYIDESGSFVNANMPGAWNAVAALVVPEGVDEKIDQLLVQLKKSNGHKAGSEIKLKDLTEKSYIQFIGNVANLNAVVFSTATDAGLNTTDSVLKHQQHQVYEILRHIDKVKYKGGQRGVLFVASQIQGLSPQLYVQLLCQINLMFDVVSRVIPYYVQRDSNSLAEFRWRIDQKNISRTDFEDAFEKVSPVLLQTRSLSEPLPMIEGFDYSSMRQYEFVDGKVPDYLKEDYGIEVTTGINIQKLIRGNIKFIDSKDSPGIQVADLIVSGIRRCLRRQFLDNDKVASALGSLMVQAKRNTPPLKLLSFADDKPVIKGVARLVRLMSENCKRMFMST